MDKLKAVGLHGAPPMRATSDEDSFGNAEAVFRVGAILLRFVRDRGQEFLDLSPVSMPDRFHQFSDVEIAFGWKSVKEVLATEQPESIEAVLSRFVLRFTELSTSFSDKFATVTSARLERAAYERGQAFMNRLQDRKAD